MDKFLINLEQLQKEILKGDFSIENIFNRITNIINELEKECYKDGNINPELLSSFKKDLVRLVELHNLVNKMSKDNIKLVKESEQLLLTILSKKELM